VTSQGLRAASLVVLAVVCVLFASCAGAARGSGATAHTAVAADDEAHSQDAVAPKLPLAVRRPGAEPVGEPPQLPPELTLQHCFRLALQNNKDIRVAWWGADASEAQVDGARGEFDPEVFMELSRGRTNTPVEAVPLDRTDTADGALSAGVRKRIVTGTDLELSASTDYERDLDPDEETYINPTYGPEVKLVLSQDLLKDFGVDVNRTNILIAQNNWKISAEELRSTVIQRLLEVEEAYWGLYFALAELKVREMQLQLGQELVRVADLQEEVGISAAIDVMRAESRAAERATSIIGGRNDVARSTHRLLRALGVVDVEHVQADFELVDAPTTETFETDVAEALQVAQALRPDYLQAKLAADNAGLERSFYRNQRLPSLQLFGEYAFAGLDDDMGQSWEVLDDGDHGSWLLGLRFSYPIPNRTARSDYRVSELRHRQAKLRLDALTEQITRELADALSDLHAAEGRIETTRKARELAERLLEAEQKSFTLGRSDSLDVLAAQEALGRAETAEARAQADHATALARLFAVQGNLLERKGIAFARPTER